MDLIDESQQIQATPQNTVILQSDTEPEDEDESSEEDFEIKAAEQTNNSINVETQTCYSKDKNDSDSPVVGHSSKAVNTFEANESNLDVLIFVDTLLEQLVRKQIREKEQLKWNGKIRELKYFVTLVLKNEGKWSTKKHGKSSTHYMFAEENGEFILNCWWSRKTLLFQGKNTELVEKNQLKYFPSWLMIKLSILLMKSSSLNQRK